MTVTALLVSHDGARWLPAVLDGLAAQTRRPERVVAVDTGSADEGPRLLRERLGHADLVSLPATTPYGAAVRAGLQAGAGPSTQPSEWVWLLHDDSAPEPHALERLLGVAEENPDVAVLGPKLREWPSLRRLLEVGVSLSGTGRRETGLERGEYDQGQHDRTREVLAVNTAGMLVRRELLEELGGFDDRLPVFGNDIDLGWRAARAGHRTLVVPEAVVFHAEASHRGSRTTPLTTRRPRQAERRAALYTLLVNAAAAVLPFQVVRLLLGSLLRALGLLVARAPGEAFDELAALARTYARPDRVVAGRLGRRRSARVPARRVRRLLPPFWLPYRHGLDAVTDLATALGHQAADLSGARERRAAQAETGPVAEETQNLPSDSGLLARLLGSPTGIVFLLLVLLALAGTRGRLGAGMLSGGALLPAPPGAGHWWQLYLEPWHQVGVGSGAPAGAFVLPLAVAGTVLLGKAWLVVDLLFFLAVPLAAFGAHSFLLALGAGRISALWGAVAYGLLPVLTGAVGEGRLGTVLAAVVLPWLARSALFLGPASTRDRRWRAAWRCALWLGLLSAFVPVAWPAAVALALCALVAAALLSSRWRTPSVWGPVLVALAVTPVLLLPWSVLVLTHQGPGAWLHEAGLPARGLLGDLSAWDVVLGRPAEVGAAPAWLGFGVPLAALAALVRPDTRRRVLGPWAVLVLALGLAALLASGVGRSGDAGQGGGTWLGFPLLLAQAGAITAAAVAGTRVGEQLSGSSFGWRQPLGLVAVTGAVVSPLLGLGWWAVHGTPGPLDRGRVTEVPTYMADAAAADPDHGVLLVSGSHADGFDYALLRGPGRRLGEASVPARPGDQQHLTGLVGDLVTAGSTDDVARLSHHAVQYLYAPPPADAQLAGTLDSVSGLVSASAVRPGARAWQVEAHADGAALPGRAASPRPWLLGVQGVALLLAVVLALPSRRPGR